MAGHVFLMGTALGAMYSDHCSPALRVEARQVSGSLVSYGSIALLWFPYFSCSLSVGRCRKNPRPPIRPVGALGLGGCGRLTRS